MNPSLLASNVMEVDLSCPTLSWSSIASLIFFEQMMLPAEEYLIAKQHPAKGIARFAGCKVLVHVLVNRFAMNCRSDLVRHEVFHSIVLYGTGSPSALKVVALKVCSTIS